MDNGRRAKVAYAQVQGIAVGAVREVASKPIVVIDLLLNLNERSEALLRSIRMRSDQFDPVRGTPHEGTSTENLPVFLREVHEHKNALALPHQAPALGQPFRVFKFLRGYQRRILKVDS